MFFGSADGLLTASGTYVGSSAAQSMLLHDVDGDGHPDLVLEGVDGRIEILHGSADGSFAAASEGGSGGADATTGLGGHLVAATDADGLRGFYTATPAGLSVIVERSDLSLSLQGIYNAGPGRTSFAVGDFNGDGIWTLQWTRQRAWLCSWETRMGACWVRGRLLRASLR